jgi:D-alanyl-D-alanine dipeptidase
MKLWMIVAVLWISAGTVFAQEARAGLVDVQSLNPKIVVALAYSTTQNFMGQDVYGELKTAYLQREVALKLAKAQVILQTKKSGYQLKILDAARPRSIQYQMWALVKDTAQQQYVANPESGSVHNYGCAVDLTIVDSLGKELDMGTPYDFFGDLAQPQYEKKFLEQGQLTSAHVANRKLLRAVMLDAGFFANCQ